MGYASLSIAPRYMNVPCNPASGIGPKNPENQR